MVTIKLINVLANLFDTNLIMLSQKARDNNKLPDLQALLSNLKIKKCCIKQTTKINLV